MVRNNMIEDDLAVRLINHDILSTPVSIEIIKEQIRHGHKAKLEAESIAVDVKKRQERVELVGKIIQELNNLTDSSNNVDISNNVELQQKLIEISLHDEEDETLRGVDIPMVDGDVRKVYSSTERDHLVQNLTLSTDAWEKQSKTLSQKMNILAQESERYMMLATHTMKKEGHLNESIARGIKGG